MEKYIPFIFIYLAMINAYGLIICLIDKILAMRHKWRISERHLIVVAVIGGAVGIFIGMKLFRHKTKKPKFYITVPLFCLFWIAVATLLIYIYYFK